MLQPSLGHPGAQELSPSSLWDKNPAPVWQVWPAVKLSICSTQAHTHLQTEGTKKPGHADYPTDQSFSYTHIKINTRLPLSKLSPIPPLWLIRIEVIYKTIHALAFAQSPAQSHPQICRYHPSLWSPLTPALRVPYP